MQVVPDLIAERMRCPRCGASVTDDGDDIRCGNDHLFAKRPGYVDFSREADPGGSTERTLASFGYEWNAFDEVRDEDERFAEIYFRDLDLDGLASKVGLDAGCGKGRFTRILAAHLAAEVALDGSSAVEAAARNLASLPNVTVVKADLRDELFAPGSFDFVSSLGVLHHLDDPRAGFERLVSYLAPKGQILLYLYSRPSETGARSIALSLATALRTVTVRLPHRTLKALSTPIAGALYGTMVLPGRWGERREVPALAGLPMDTYRDKPFRSLVLDTFDRLSAPVEYRYVWKDLEPWFSDAGLVVDAARDETGWFILAHKP
ncbi:MAG: class I SAM-dependent methyltransferase [Acidimicrobiales bacterium]